MFILQIMVQISFQNNDEAVFISCATDMWWTNEQCPPDMACS